MVWTTTTTMAAYRTYLRARTSLESGPNIGAGSNIFLSAGQVDPWRAAGIPFIRPAAGGSATPSATIEIHENLMGAHHYDIRASNPLDTESVKECRTKQKAAIARWIAGWKASPPLPITASVC